MPLVRTSPNFPCSPSETQGRRALLVSWRRVPSPLAVFPVHASLRGRGLLRVWLSSSPPHQCSSFLAPWELGPPLCLGRKEELPLPTQPQARGKEEAGERPKVPPPPTRGSLQAEVSGAAGPHPQSPSGLSLYLPHLSVSRPVILCSVTVKLQ